MEKFTADIAYERGNLKPFISEETMQFHYGKHHVGYANTLNLLIKDTQYQELSLEQIIVKSRGVDQKIFNNAAQLFNHNFYWKCLKPGIVNPKGNLLKIVERQFGDFEKFKELYISCAATLFGSGWSWLIEKDGELNFVNTQNAEIPHENGARLLCVVDLWEHAYYIDYRNDRNKYIDAVVHSCINWEYCESLLE